MKSRDETKAWVRAVLAHRRMKPTELARAVHRAPSTLNRFLNDPGAEHDLSRDTVERIAELVGVAPYELPSSGPRRGPGFKEAEATPFEPAGDGADKLVDNAIRALARDTNSLAPWRLRSVALVCAGYLPGDILIVDLNERARAHDVVCAQVYDWQRGQAETVFRLYEAPYLLASTTDPGLSRPLVVDDDAVAVKGVVVSSVRPRRSLGMAA